LVEHHLEALIELTHVVPAGGESDGCTQGFGKATLCQLDRCSLDRSGMLVEGNFAIAHGRQIVIVGEQIRLEGATNGRRLTRKEDNPTRRMVFHAAAAHRAKEFQPPGRRRLRRLLVLGLVIQSDGRASRRTSFSRRSPETDGSTYRPDQPCRNSTL
jgi:hypothetical protein